jgi:hypothetical protein
MANIEGNEIALRSVFGQYKTLPRDGTDARTDNDNKPPFFTQNYVIQPAYSENLAPSWCYGVTYEGSSIEGAPADNEGPLFVAWGTIAQAGTSESILWPGQTLSFPRGTRRVFVRRSAPAVQEALVKLTWKLDPFAWKNWSPGAETVTKPDTGTGVDANSVISPIIRAPGGVITSYPRSQLLVKIDNVSTVPVDYSLILNVGTGIQIDSATINAGNNRTFMYSPSLVVASLPAGVSGHNTVFTGSASIVCNEGAPAPAGPLAVVTAWWR